METHAGFKDAVQTMQNSAWMTLLHFVAIRVMAPEEVGSHASRHSGKGSRSQVCPELPSRGDDHVTRPGCEPIARVSE